jgi:hypothetical protein
MNSRPEQVATDQEVPDSVIPAGSLPAMQYRDLPEPVPIWRMLGPSIILAGLALGSGEFIFWPYITYKSGFVFFWACLLGVTTQYFLNMEITRWSLATGESAITSFVRLGRFWAVIFLLLNIIPWMIPAWSKGAAQVLSWMIWEPQLQADGATGLFVIAEEQSVTWIAIAGMVFCAAILTAGPVVYETVEKIQVFLVSMVLLLIVVLAIWLVRWDAVTAQFSQVMTLGFPNFIPPADSGLDAVFLLGALAFAGAGGTTNLGQSNYVKDKGYGMGHHIGRITSPITGQQEASSSVGYHFRDTELNRQRWRGWWRASCWEHFWSFFVTCLVCLVLLTLISYSTFYGEDGNLREGASRYGDKMNFVLGEANEVGSVIGPAAKNVFLVMGIIILLTTEFGVLDAVSRISTDLVKVTWLRDHATWSESRLYYVFLWGTVLLGSGILLLEQVDFDVSAFQLFKLTAALNGAVMFIYSILLAYVNRYRLPAHIRLGGWRLLIMIWAICFFGFFTIRVGYVQLLQLIG